MTPEQLAAGQAWAAARRRRRNHPQNARDAWAAFNAAEQRAEDINDRSWAR